MLDLSQELKRIAKRVSGDVDVDVTDWELLDRSGIDTYLWGSWQDDMDKGWWQQFKKQAEDHGWSVTVKRGHIYLNR